MAQHQIFIVDENEATRDILYNACVHYPTKPTVKKVHTSGLIELIEKEKPFIIIINAECDLQDPAGALSKQIKHQYRIPILHVLPENFSDSQFETFKLDYTFFIKHPLGENEVRAAINTAVYINRLELRTDPVENQPRVVSSINELDDKYLFQLLLDNLPDGVYFKDTHSRFVKVNQAQAKLIGLKNPADVIGKSDFDFFKHADAAFEDEMKIIKTGKPIINKIEEISADGKEHAWMSATKVPVHDKNGNILGTMGLSRDVTELVENEKAVQEQENNFHSLISNLPEAVVVHDFKKIIFCNEYTSQITGYQASEIIGQDITKFISSTYHDRIYNEFEQLAPNKKLTPFQVELIDRLGKLIPVNIRASVFNYHDQQAILFVINDLRILKKRETELEQAKEQLEKMNTSMVESMDELRRFNEVMIAREGRVLELKKEINTILSQKGLPKKYTTAGLEDTDEPGLVQKETHS